MIKKKGSEFYSVDQPTVVLLDAHRPDFRQISARWLVGIILAGITSCTLIGIAFFAALNGGEQFAKSPEFLRQDEMLRRTYDLKANKSNRLVATHPRRNFDDKRKLELSTTQKIGEREVIRTQAFELLTMALAEKHAQNFNYPEFNALNLFADTPFSAEVIAQIYGSKIDTEVTLRTVDFPTAGAAFDNVDSLTAEEVEYALKLVKLELSSDEISVLHYLNPMQMETNDLSHNFSDTVDVKIVQENVSVLTGCANDGTIKSYSEDIIPFSRNESIIAMLHRANYEGEDATRVSQILNLLMGNDKLDVGSVLRLGIKSNRFGKSYIVRATIYKNKEHYLSIALNDHNQYIECTEPEITPALKEILEGKTPIIEVASDKLPKVYDAVFQSAMAHDMTQDMAKQLIRMLANDVDMQSRISLDDSLKVFYTIPDSDDEKTEREILYVDVNFKGIMRRYYRFQSKDGKFDYYNTEGRNSKQFLLRKPVPNAIFGSPFGIRRHPILGYMRMHTGVDWAASRGSPILAAGDGEIIIAAWNRGYGYHTEIRHANGYVSSYSHQSAFAKGIEPGTKVHQGQVIGYVGSTGLSTGPHCHFEVIVNGTKVDPMRIRLPDNKSLTGEELKTFKNNRDRIDALIKNSLS
ncbi:MAG: hypothetical protein JSC188_000381 [Candidatus Tokpelaia sp. JSC188]|nr:MAG: hypothetical protein JSC188_000381 [Candidatus Tokpelaia sp. JSC188]